jgi:hypothetical protein
MITRIFFLILVVISFRSAGWEAYEFDISTISVVNDTCEIGMSNLGTKVSDDNTICDTPTSIVINNCSSPQSNLKMSVLLASKMAGKRVFHQAIAQASSAPCKVNAYRITVVE